MKYMLRYLMLAFCLFTSAIVIGQDSDNTDFTSAELSAFVDVYLEMKSFKSPDLTELDIKSFKVSKHRYQEIMKKELEGKKVRLSDNEKALVESIEMSNLEFQLQKEKVRNDKILKAGITKEKYELIGNKYKSDIEFQHSLKPFFEAAFKKRN